MSEPTSPSIQRRASRTAADLIDAIDVERIAHQRRASEPNLRSSLMQSSPPDLGGGHSLRTGPHDHCLKQRPASQSGKGHSTRSRRHSVGSIRTSTKALDGPISPISVRSAPPGISAHEKSPLLKLFDRFYAAIGRPVDQSSEDFVEVPYKAMGPRDKKFSIKTVRMLVSPDVDEYLPWQQNTQSSVGTVPTSSMLQHDSWRKSKEATRLLRHSTTSSISNSTAASTTSTKSNTSAAWKMPNLPSALGA